MTCHIRGAEKGDLDACQLADKTRQEFSAPPFSHPPAARLIPSALTPQPHPPPILNPNPKPVGIRCGRVLGRGRSAQRAPPDTRPPNPHATLEATQGQTLSQSPTDATRFWWGVWELTEETIDLPLGWPQDG